MRRNILVALGAAILVIGLLAACSSGTKEAAPSPTASSAPATDGGGEPGSDSGTTVTVTSHEFAFDPKDVTAPADTDVTLELVNEGSLEHDWSIEGQNVLVKAGPGETGTTSFNLPAGSYTVLCTIPGHASAGMIGTLTVN